MFFSTFFSILSSKATIFVFQISLFVSINYRYLTLL